MPKDNNDLIIHKILKDTNGFLLFSETFLLLIHRLFNISIEEAEQIRRICYEEKNTNKISEKYFTHNELCNFEIDTIVQLNIFIEERQYFARPKGQFISDAIMSCWGVYYKLYFFREFVNVFCKDEIAEIDKKKSDETDV